MDVAAPQLTPISMRWKAGKFDIAKKQHSPLMHCIGLMRHIMSQPAILTIYFKKKAEPSGPVSR